MTHHGRTRPRLVVGVDDNHVARRALIVARRLASRLQGRLVVAHAIPAGPRHPYALAHNAQRLRDEVEAAARDCVSRLVDGVGCRPPDEIVIGRGVPSDFLRRTADVREASLIVVGARARGAVQRAVLGSVSCSLAATARRPVVIVPAGCDDGVLSAADDPDTTILCGVDGSRYSVAAVAVATDLAERMGARLVIAHAWQPPAPEERRSGLRLVHRMLEHAASAPGVDACLAEGSPGEALNALAEDADLVVVGSGGRGPAGGALLGSTSTLLALHGRCPVVVAPATTPCGADGRSRAAQMPSGPHWRSARPHR
jgi:nucleotide-binding universal stress UspA family protein